MFCCLATVTRARGLSRTQWPSHAARPPGRDRAGMGQWGLEALGPQCSLEAGPGRWWKFNPASGGGNDSLSNSSALCQKGGRFKEPKVWQVLPLPHPSLSRLVSCGDRSSRSASAPCHFSLPDSPRTGCTQGSDKVCTRPTAHTLGAMNWVLASCFSCRKLSGLLM